MSNIKCQIKLLSERTSKAPPVIFIITIELYFSDEFEWNKKGLEDMALKYINKVSLWLLQLLYTSWTKIEIFLKRRATLMPLLCWQLVTYQESLLRISSLQGGGVLLQNWICKTRYHTGAPSTPASPSGWTPGWGWGSSWACSCSSPPPSTPASTSSPSLHILGGWRYPPHWKMVRKYLRRTQPSTCPCRQKENDSF